MDDLDRFMSKVEKTNECWLWTAAKNQKGYGIFTVRVNGKKKNVRAHRWIYQQMRGEIEYQIDHLCRVRHCVNPDHMEDVTSRENTLRGKSIAAENARKTHCPKCGSEYEWRNKRQRRCKPCWLAYQREWMRRYRKREQDAPDPKGTETE